MGVPKFFRWLSERYPAISQLIAENRIPEFDALYLDMNGIIHNCTHKDSGDVSFRLSEEEMFIRIFNYIEHLFGKIKPKQIFFLAVDGVAPRAKMNQQRARRFRTALDAEQAREKAIREGKEIPKEEPFDSNCITPGTEFMAKLSLQLRYFINKKVSEDKEWQGCEIVLSGHEVPGEGEHKIMEYIRNARAQPSYSANMRHCLYGLDADLIMLGLLSHDPHFCLLREEVTFGRASTQASKELEHQNFYLMHLCIVREYLELEFQDLKRDGAIDFKFDLERVIDDFILMAFFIGNDFLPNLPRFHINEGALATMFSIYKSVLPKCGGYINEGGVVNVERLALLLEELGKEEDRYFVHENEGAKWLQNKKVENGTLPAASRGKGKLIVTSEQKALWKNHIRKFLTSRSQEPLDLGYELKAAERKFVQDLADTARVNWATKQDDEARRHLVLSFPPKPEGDDDDEEEDDESQLAVSRIVKKYDNAEVVDTTAEEAQAQLDVVYKQKFAEWKDNYYLEKMPEWTKDNMGDELRKMTENYVEGLQWVLFYYYQGIASWGWFYAYHYSPLISDVRKGLKANLKFKLGQPFRPFEQLMGVLPDRSKRIVPQVYWDLMINPASPIIDFYPRDFTLDMNGKKMEWEAVVKIPFIDEKRLLDAMATKNSLLSADEQSRNGFNVPIKFVYSNGVDFIYPSPLVGIFPDLPHCHCVENMFEQPATEGLTLRQGLMSGAMLNAAALAGFPSLATLDYNATLGFHGVNVFQQDSRNESMVVTLADAANRTHIEYAKTKLGQRCFVGYPFLQEGKIVRVSDELFVYSLKENGQIGQKDHSNRDIDDWHRQASRAEDFHSKRLGIIIGDVESMVHVEMLKGLVKTDDGATVKEYGAIPGMLDSYPTQTIVDEVVNEDQRFIEKTALPLEEEFAVGTTGFYLGEFAYGRPLAVAGYSNNKLEINVLRLVTKEPEFAKQVVFTAERQNRYSPSFQVAKDLGLHPLALSKITSSYQVLSIGDLKVNLGLNLKFQSKKQKVLGYTRSNDKGWEFSNLAIHLIVQYMTAFPDFFAGLQRNVQNSDVTALDLFSTTEKATTRVKEMGQWLKAQGVNTLQKVPLDAEQLDSNVVTALAEASVMTVGDALNIIPTEMKLLKGVPRSAILKPADAEQRLGAQKFQLGDRVVYVQDIGKVPIAMRGTVVGISRVGSNNVLDVLFDMTFMSGTTLDGRCPPFRGQTVPATSVLNLTERQVIAGSRAAIERRPVPSLTTIAGGYGPPGANGRGQYRDAPAPAPLQGSWRGAINGSGGGGGGVARGRGRGSLNIQPSSLVYRPAPQGQQPVNGRGGGGGYQGTNGRATRAGGGLHSGRGSYGNGHNNNNNNNNCNGDSSATSYNAVPPPANLDRGGPRGGRGRGMANGRGAPRGRGEGSVRGRGRGGATEGQSATS